MPEAPETRQHRASVYDAPSDLRATIEDDHLVYFLLNVGNADSQVIVLPRDEQGERHVIVIDVGTVGPAKGKVPLLISELSTAVNGTSLLSGASEIRLLVVTHPHQDHVSGVPNLLGSLGDRVKEVWDAAFYWKNGKWHETMHWLEQHPEVDRLHPTAGTRRHIGEVGVTALSPSIRLRNSYDSYGVHVNNSSIACLIEYPISRAFTGEVKTFPQIGLQDRKLRRERLLLGGDAQTESWSNVEVDYPHLVKDHAPEHRLLGQAKGLEPLGAELFKVPHHCSKNGLNLELVARIDPYLSLISAEGTGTGHAFPHAVAIEQLREAIQPTVTGANERSPDYELGIHTTGDKLRGGGPLGSIAVVVDPKGKALDDRYHVWRLGDRIADAVTAEMLAGARRYEGKNVARSAQKDED